MSARSKLTLTTVTTQASTIGQSPTTMSGTDAGNGVTYQAANDLASLVLDTQPPGAGAAFVDVDVPNIVEELLIVPISGAPIAVRLNGLPAVVTGSGATYAGLSGKRFSIGLDGAAPVTITFSAGATTAAACAREINAAMGSIVATVNGAGALILAGALSGDALAAARTWQYGRLILADVDSGTLAALGFVAGTTYGSGNDLLVSGPYFARHASTVTAMQVTRVEVSGTGEIAVHYGGKAA